MRTVNHCERKELASNWMVWMISDQPNAETQTVSPHRELESVQ